MVKDEVRKKKREIIEKKGKRRKDKVLRKIKRNNILKFTIEKILKF